MKLSDRKSARIADLSVLPVFLNLQDRPVLIGGGSDAAAWKAELMAAAGARVTVCAPEAGEEMQRVACERNGVQIEARGWRDDDFEGCAMALGDPAECDAGAFVAAARRAAVPVNMIDDAGHSDFTFGSIVNRSPVVIGISTSGAAPVLGQAVRRRIETLLPQWIADWGQLASRLRSGITSRFPLAADRRRFWNWFAERAFLAPPGNDLDLDSRDNAAGGKVTLVGAGPGAADLLTLRAVRALQAADVILFDDLVSDDVLELARREAKRMLVGKRGGRESCRQEDINATMLTLARQGRNVVRLKSGDPSVFGRAGEEISALREEGIPVEIVPGITAASGMAAALGISLTHRDHAQSLRFVTGHSRAGQLPDDLDWQGIADGRTTNVFYMAGRTSPAIARRLIDGGLPADTPAAFVWNISRPDQRIRTACLSDIAASADGGFPSQPVLMAVGRALSEYRAEQPATGMDEGFQAAAV